jgi:hypothetical protein
MTQEYAMPDDKEKLDAEYARSMAAEVEAIANGSPGDVVDVRPQRWVENEAGRRARRAAKRGR